ncbi:MAG: hypothetical protein HFE75_02445 [Firmicutes bacterium]|jgi:hypothetical protein|nr:hypothetical protein [Bacillota bacterium]NBI62968.1 hypothetical protein [Clostridiales bacterium]
MINIQNERRHIVAVLSLLALFAIFCTSVVPVNAANYDLKKSVSNKFSKTWTLTATDTNNKNTYCLKLIYGFNTRAINEDIACASASVVNKGKKHRAIIKNSNGTHYGPERPYTGDSHKEVRHKGKTVTYINRTQR